MAERILVVGAGAAGLAAAWAARRAGCEVQLVDVGVGSSGLGTGAVDDRPWEQVARASDVLQLAATASPLPPSVAEFAEVLGLWRLAQVDGPLVRLATTAGRVRLARGCDRGLLDLAQLPTGARVLLPRVPRAEWDADQLARSLNDDVYARSRALKFSAVDAKLLRFTGDERIAAVELAAHHDDPQRLRWLAERLREMLSRNGEAHAVLLGPWLGAEQPRSGALAKALELPAGEALAGMGNAPGLRFDAARAVFLDRLGITPVAHRALEVRSDRRGVRCRLEDGSQLSAHALVLALGGVAAGGVVYQPPEQEAGQDMPSAGRVPFRLSLDAPVMLQAHGQRIDVVSSMFGPTLDELAWPEDADPGLLEAIGVACEGTCAAPGVFAAGDVVADRPRTMLQAVHSGVRAGEAAAAVTSAVD
jgi:glycerol-3-phosphate dehydrogenase subunit B